MTAELRHLASVLGGDLEPVGTEGWSVTELVDVPTDAVLWGEARAPRSVADVLAREVALARLRLGGGNGWRLNHVWRVVPTSVRGPRVRDPLRRLLRGRVIAHVARERDPVLVGAFHDRAGVRADGPIRITSVGTVMQPVRTIRSDAPAILRLGLAATFGDPTSAVEVLSRLEGSGVPAPRVLAHGLVDDVAWLVESRLPGRPPRRVDDAMLAEVARIVARFPRAPEGTVPQVHADLGLVARVAGLSPSDADLLRGIVDDLGPTWRLGHGDLWGGNLLAEGRRITGVVDWDAARLAAAPGTDLLQCHATAVRAGRGRSLGAAWRDRPWEDERFVRVLEGHAEEYEVRPTPAYRRALGVAWWAQEVAGTLRRVPARAHDPAWMEGNVLEVMRSVTRPR